MRAIVIWDEEEGHYGTQKNVQGFLWLNRGILAKRIHRSNLSERSLRNVVEQGTSLIAWQLILDLYKENKSVNSIV